MLAKCMGTWASSPDKRRVEIQLLPFCSLRAWGDEVKVRYVETDGSVEEVAADATHPDLHFDLLSGADPRGRRAHP